MNRTLQKRLLIAITLTGAAKTTLRRAGKAQRAHPSFLGFR